MNRNLTVGQKVFLSLGHDWRKGEDNPLTCDGVVTRTSNQHLGVGVIWSQGISNSYNASDSDLIPVLHRTREAARAAARKNPNLTVKRTNSGSWKVILKQKLVMDDYGIAEI